MSLYIGLMSGTSADGMDVALVDFSSSVHLVDALCLDYPADLRTQLRSTALAPELPVKTIMQLDRTIAARSAEAVAVLLQSVEVQVFRPLCSLHSARTCGTVKQRLERSCTEPGTDGTMHAPTCNTIAGRPRRRRGGSHTRTPHGNGET